MMVRRATFGLLDRSRTAARRVGRPGAVCAVFAALLGFALWPGPLAPDTPSGSGQQASGARVFESPLASLRQLERTVRRHRTPPRWRVLLAANFRLLHDDRAIAHRTALAAERWRRQLRLSWGLDDAPWDERCDIYLYRTFSEMRAFTDGRPKAGSAQVRPSRLFPGKVLGRRVNLVASDPDLFTATLPHEITHLVLADAVGGTVPLWANEGAAVLAEGASRQGRYRKLLLRARERHALLGVGWLLGAQHYPDGAARRLFYAQSASLVRFLLARGGRVQFARFVAASKIAGYRAALLEHYGLSNGAAQLQQRWRTTLGRQRQKAGVAGAARLDRDLSRRRSAAATRTDDHRDRGALWQIGASLH